MEPKARQLFLTKLVTQGFSIDDQGETLFLRPRGAESEAELVIQEVTTDVWNVVGASGKYARYGRGKNRTYFETYLRQWIAQIKVQAAVGS